jgi:hypothetical protein
MWALMGASAHLGAVARAAGVLDIGLAFPRANETYERTDDFPIVFALQNSKLAEHLKPSIWFQILNVTGDIETLVDSTHEFNWTSASENDPYFLWSHLRVEGEGRLRLLWQPRWSACVESRDEVEVVRNRTDDNFLVEFEIKAGGEKADLVAATGGDSENCPNEGVGIDVTDKTLEAPVGSSGRETCAVLGSSSSTPTSNPCRVKIDKAAVESMQAADLKEKGRGLNPPEECPKDGLAHPRLTAAGVASLAAVLGAGFFLA